MTGHQSQVPYLISAYFERVGFDIGTITSFRGHPLIAEVFFDDGRGWVKYPYKKRVSLSELRRAKREGVSAVAVKTGGRLADFTIKEIMAEQRRQAKLPLLGGNLI